VRDRRHADTAGPPSAVSLAFRPQVSGLSPPPPFPVPAIPISGKDKLKLADGLRSETAEESSGEMLEYYDTKNRHVHDTFMEWSGRCQVKW